MCTCCTADHSCSHSHRELIMENPDATGEELCATISTLPCQLSADDMDDFFSLAQYYASRTPQSFRKVWHTMHTVVSCYMCSLTPHLCVPTCRTTIAYCLAVVAV